MSFGGGGGSSSIAGGSDVTLNNPQNKDVLGYNTSSSKWQNQVVTTGFTAVSGAKVIVAQDFTTASTARCTSRTDVSVRWRGPVEPTNMLIGDEWYVTS